MESFLEEVWLLASCLFFISNDIYLGLQVLEYKKYLLNGSCNYGGCNKQPLFELWELVANEKVKASIEMVLSSLLHSRELKRLSTSLLLL
ncbi:hypothetical protein ACB092_11G216600 [Castanea dentata]